MNQIDENERQEEKQRQRGLFSERAMNWVNSIFVILLFILRGGVLFAALIVWIVYLVFCVKRALNKIHKGVDIAMIILAVVVMVLNILPLFQIRLL